MEQSFSLSKILGDVSKPAAFPDTKYHHRKNTHGYTVKQKYDIDGTYEKAVLGYPYVRLIIQAAKETDNDSDVQRQIHISLVLAGSLDDTYVLYHSDQKTLVEMQKLTHAANQSVLPNHPFITLLHFCQENQISPGESADLLSTSLFILKIEEIWTVNTHACPISLND